MTQAKAITTFADAWEILKQYCFEEMTTEIPTNPEQKWLMGWGAGYWDFGVVGYQVTVYKDGAVRRRDLRPPFSFQDYHEKYVNHIAVSE